MMKGLNSKNLLTKDSQLKEEYEEQKRIKEVLSNMSLKNPSNEVWDNYWKNYHNKVERSIAWIFISIGVMVLFAFGVVEAVDNFFEDTNSPPIINFAVSVTVIGGVILIISVFREKFFVYRRDKYKEIQR